MKNVNLKEIQAGSRKVIGFVWGVLSHNLGWKLLSFFLAVMMWFYIVSSDQTITRSKTISGVEIVVTGSSVLQSRGFALLTDPSIAVPEVRVRVDVPQSSYASITADSVRVELDLSTIRQTGVQQVALNATSSYGTVAQVSPAQVEIEVEELDQLIVPVNVELSGKDRDNYWYSVMRTNPSNITISGPSSVVHQVSYALVQMDVSDMVETRTLANRFTLVNAQGEEIALSNLVSRSTSSIMVGVNIYPQKQLSVSSAVDTATTGVPADGYYVSAIDLQPDSLTVAAEQSLLSELNFLTIEPVDVSERKKSFSTVARINSIDGIVNPTNAQVVVTVYIEEEQITQIFDEVPVSIRGLSANLKGTLSAQTVSVRVTGPQSAVLKMTRADLSASVDASNLVAGVYDLPVAIEIENYEGIDWSCEPQLLRITTAAQ